MANRKPEVRMRSFGIYTGWDPQSKQLPRFLKATTEVPARIGIEFGFILQIKNAKNRELDFCIDHPGIRDDSGRIRQPFDGSVFIKQNDWSFYLGDTLWEPIEDKLGDWKMSVRIDDVTVAEKIFSVQARETTEGQQDQNLEL